MVGAGQDAYRRRVTHRVQRRCSECRASFIPIACVRDRQRVCGTDVCRLRRRAKASRRRRSAAVQDHRVDERARQQTSRARRRAAAATGAQPVTEAAGSRAGHEPSSDAITSKQLGKLDQIVDKILDRITRLSRAELRREIAVILRAGAPFSGYAPPAIPAPVTSRALSASP